MILFDLDEIAAAARDFLFHRDELVPGDQVAAVAVHDDQGPAVDLIVRRGTAEARQSLRGAQLAAAMIMYCVARRIPLPHRAQKTLKGVGQGLALSFSQGLEAAEVDLILRRDQLEVA